jgi:predicted MFS family arabinose efflux permease
MREISASVTATLGPAEPNLSTARAVCFTVAVAIIVLPLFAPQPLIGVIGPSLNLSPWAMGAAATVTLLGYAAGLFLVTPLTDLIENRRVILATIVVDVIALVVAASAPSATVFFGAAFAVGVATSAIQMLVSTAAMLVPEVRRGRVIGNVVSGLMVGILLSRPIAGLATEAWGWRGSYAFDAAAISAMALFLSRVLPRHRPTNKAGYFSLIASFGMLIKKDAVLRRRASYQALCMASVSMFWTAIALRLAAPPFGFSEIGIALFTFAGVGGAVIAPIAGRLGDRGLTGPATRVAHGAMIVALIVAGTAGADWFGFNAKAAPRLALALLVVAALLLDLGAVGDQTLGRRAINLARPEARGRVNGFYTGFFFLGGAFGSSLASVTWAHGGWSRVCIVAAGFGVAALVLGMTETRIA